MFCLSYFTLLLICLIHFILTIIIYLFLMMTEHLAADMSFGYIWQT